MILLGRDKNIQIPHVLAVFIMHWPSQSGFLLLALIMNFAFQGAEVILFQKEDSRS